MNKRISLVLLLILSIMVFFACSLVSGGGSSSGSSGSSGSKGNSDDAEGIMYSIEDDEVSVTKVKRDKSDFYGSWEAKSDRAKYLYGNIDIKVNESGTWSGDITGEKLNGIWEYHSDYMHMNNDLFSFDLAFDKSGNLVLIDTDSEDEINIVLTKK